MEHPNKWTKRTDFLLNTGFLDVLMRLKTESGHISNSFFEKLYNTPIDMEAKSTTASPQQSEFRTTSLFLSSKNVLQRE